MAIERRKAGPVERDNRGFGEFFGRPLPDLWRSTMPAIDVFEKDGKVVVKADLPGLKKEDIDVSVVKDRLIIRGHRKEETEEKRENYYRAERFYGTFTRSVKLPYPVESKEVEATYDDGVLEITLPQSSESKSTRVEVSSNKGESKSK